MPTMLRRRMAGGRTRRLGIVAKMLTLQRNRRNPETYFVERRQSPIPAGERSWPTGKGNEPMKTQEHNGQRFGAIACSTFFVTGWQRKYRTLDGCNEPYVARVFRRLLDADDRWQRIHKAGKYSFPNDQEELLPPVGGTPQPRKTTK